MALIPWSLTFKWRFWYSYGAIPSRGGLHLHERSNLHEGVIPQGELHEQSYMVGVLILANPKMDEMEGYI